MEGTYFTINRPNWFKNKEFLTWLNSSARIFTWHKKDELPSEFSDVILYYEDPEDSFADLPKNISEELYSLCNTYNACLVWITNLEENFNN